MAKRRPDPEPRHIEVLDPTWSPEDGPPSDSGSADRAADRMLGRLAWFSVLAALSTVLVALSVVVVGAAVLLSEPDPVVFDRDPPPPRPRRRVVARGLEQPLPARVRTRPAQRAGGEAPEPLDDALPAAEVPTPAPEVPVDLPTEELVPGVLPGAIAPGDDSSLAGATDFIAEAGDADDGEAASAEDLAPQALQADRVTIRVGTDPIGADVLVDGRFRGRTPVKLMLNPGRYEVVLSLGGSEARWSLDATRDERKCFSLQGSQLQPSECS